MALSPPSVLLPNLFIFIYNILYFLILQYNFLKEQKSGIKCVKLSALMNLNLIPTKVKGKKRIGCPRPYPNASLADLCNETTMSPELRRAYQNNDRAVMMAYGFSIQDMT